MEDPVYTHAAWRVRPGRQQDFIAAWEELGRIFSELPNPPAGPGTLIQSVEDPLQFYSFGAWRSAEDVAAMRGDPRAQRGIETARSLCTEATPGMYQVVRRTPAPHPPSTKAERPPPRLPG